MRVIGKDMAPPNPLPQCTEKSSPGDAAIPCAMTSAMECDAAIFPDAATHWGMPPKCPAGWKCALERGLRTELSGQGTNAFARRDGSQFFFAHWCTIGLPSSRRNLPWPAGIGEKSFSNRTAITK